MTGRELAPDSRSSPRAVVREVEGLKDSISLTCRLSCLSSPFKKNKKSIFMLFSGHNESPIRRQARGFSFTCRLLCLSSSIKRKEKFAHVSNHSGSLVRRQARGFSVTCCLTCLSSPFTQQEKKSLRFSASTTEAS